MRLKVNVTYNDIELKRLVRKGEFIDVTKKRGEELLTKKSFSGKPIVIQVEEVKKKKKIEKAVPVADAEQAVKATE